MEFKLIKQQSPEIKYHYSIQQINKQLVVSFDLDFTYFNYTDITTMDQTIDYRSQYFHLKTQNQYLKSELEEYQYRQKILKKQLQIMNQLKQRSINTQNDQYLKQQNQQFRTQLVSIYKEKQQLETLNQNYIEKINDLKHNNSELNKLNQKLTKLHEREMEVMRREMETQEKSWGMERQRKLAKQKETLEKKLESCANIAQQMENFYVKEIKKYKQIIKNKDQEITTLSNDLQCSRTRRLSQGECSSRQNRQIQQYQNEIRELKNKIKFLISKLESMQEEAMSKLSIGSLNEQLIQSKMMQSSSSIDSFKITPHSSAASNKDPPTKRNPSNAKSPNKLIYSHKLGKNQGPLIDRSNF